MTPKLYNWRGRKLAARRQARSKFEIELADGSRTALRYNIRSLITLESWYGSTHKLAEVLGSDDVTVTDITRLLYAGSSRGMSFEKFASLLLPDQFSEYARVAVEAFHDGLAEPEVKR